MTSAALISPSIHAHGGTALKALSELSGTDNSNTRKTLDEITRDIVQMRDGLVAQRRAGENVNYFLTRTNAILSSQFGTDFPVSCFNKKRIDETSTTPESSRHRSRPLNIIDSQLSF